MTGPSVAALGGGHGLYASLTALRSLTDRLTAIVTVADDGGSSGRLRDELHVPPPGDLRMALSALCEDTEWGRTWRDVLQHRFSTDGPLDGHALGNLLIAGLWSRTGDVVEGLDWVARLLRSRGRVLPVAGEPLRVAALVDTGKSTATADGQVAVALAPGRIKRLWIEPERPVVPPQTISAIDEADFVVLGPGSWYTSVLMHFLVPDVRTALARASDRAVLTLNISDEDEETQGMTRADDVRALQELAPEFHPAAVVLDVGEEHAPGLDDALAAWGCHVLVRAVQEEGAPDRHDTVALAEAYREAFASI